MWFNDIGNFNLDFKVEDIIFGVYKNISFNSLINFCLLIGKFYVQMCNIQKKKPDLSNYILTLKHHLSIEKQVYVKKGKSGKFSNIFLWKD